jgi:hypothetical protein
MGFLGCFRRFGFRHFRVVSGCFHRCGFSCFSNVTFQSLSAPFRFQSFRKNFQSFRIKVSTTGNKLSAVQDGAIQLSGCFSLVDLSR